MGSNPAPAPHPACLQVGSWWRPYTGDTWAHLGILAFTVVGVMALCVFVPLAEAPWLGVIATVLLVSHAAWKVVQSLEDDSLQRQIDVGDARRQMQDSARGAGQLAERLHGAAMRSFQQLFEDVEQKLDAGLQQVNLIVRPYML